VTDRNVNLEERRSRIENSPGSLFSEQLEAALYQNHPYGVPVIGWEHEMAALSRKDALDFYKRFYAPNNAVLVVAGDVTAEEVRALAEETYGKVPPVPAEKLVRPRVKEPPARAPRRLTLADPRAGQPQLHRYYLAPSYTTAAAGDAEALDVLMNALADGSTSRLYRRLVVQDKLASSSSGYYENGGLDSGKLVLYAVGADVRDLPRVEAAIDEVIAEVKANGLSEAEIKRAKAALVADHVYESDSQSTLARRYGWGLATGLTIERMESWPQDIAKVTNDDIMRVAKTFLDLKASVTGYLVPEEIKAAGAGAAPAPSAPAAAPAATAGSRS
ncbi:MAG: M16 family metallopeptidase, partial [Hyphomicrobiaceae bacterium]